MTPANDHFADERPHLIGEAWTAGSGAAFHSTSPATGEPVWEGVAAAAADVAAAVATAREAQADWADRPVAERVSLMEAGAAALITHGDDLHKAIVAETGKPHWEVATELKAMAAKIPATIDAWRQRQQDVVTTGDDGVAATRYRPHGVLAVIGPFNFPGHIPQGHIVPALLAGNTVVFKPSEFTPLAGRRLAEVWQRAGLPAGVLNLVQGGRETGTALTTHSGHDGILFTGSYRTGVALRQALVAEPGKMLALELGGNNPLVVHDVQDLDVAVRLTILSAYLTAGQRCSCARRLIVTNFPGRAAFLNRLAEAIDAIRVGLPDDKPEPFMGPVIHEEAAMSLLTAEADLVARGGVAIRQLQPLRGRPTLLAPGLIDVTDVADRLDTEWFGPLLQVIRVPDLNAAITEANRTAYGLAAALLCDNPDDYETFRRRVRAGLINWNRQTTGASSRLPFGGLGHSGNHRPSGFHAIDYCGYPVASLERDRLIPPPPVPGLPEVPAVPSPKTPR
jgi:succinylglutamic semialdehyde dehydrogenase